MARGFCHIISPVANSGIANLLEKQLIAGPFIEDFQSCRKFARGLPITSCHS
jgi:hypothetical protein